MRPIIERLWVRIPAHNTIYVDNLYRLIWFVHVVRDHQNVAGKEVVRNSRMIVLGRINQIKKSAVDLVMVVN